MIIRPYRYVGAAGRLPAARWVTLWESFAIQRIEREQVASGARWNEGCTRRHRQRVASERPW